jgi:phospholipid/cholesterol/gamma-HCH transport system permease protein
MTTAAHTGNFLLRQVAALGDYVLRTIRFWGRFALFTGSVFHRAFTPPWSLPRIAHQAVEIGIKSFPIAMLTSIFVGMVMVVQTGFQLAKFGSKGYVPGISFIANAREMVPAFCAMVVGARVAASITAEIGTMRVTEQLDAMDILNVDPMRYLCAPRFLAMIVMLPAISCLCLVTGFLGGMVVGDAALNIPPLSYYTTTLKFAKVPDVVGGLIKTVFFGGIIAVTGCYYGFKTHGGAAGVGRATTNSVVLTLVLILIFDYILGSLILSLLMPI